MDTKRFTLDTTLTLIAAYLGLFVGLIDANAINLALPAIRDNLGGGISGAQWTIDAYNITFAAVLLTAGSLGDRFGRRTLLRVGLVTFIVASLVCAAAPSLPLLLAARTVQGVGAGLMLLQGLGYLPESRDPDAASFDVPGQTLAMVGLGALTIVLVEGRTMAPTWTVALAGVAVAGIAAFLWSQGRVTRPMLPLNLFRNRRLVAALVATFTMTFGIYGLLLVNSFAFQQQRGASALATALWFLPMPLIYLVLIPVVSALAHRTGPRLLMTAGLTLMAAGTALYAAVGPQADVWLLELSFVLAGAGLALNTGPAVGLAMSAVPLQRAGLASGVVNLARLVGITVGVAVLGSAMAAIGGADGARIATMLGGLVQLIGASVALRWARLEAPAPTQKEVCHA